MGLSALAVAFGTAPLPGQTIPYLCDFESAGGFHLGPLNGQQGWVTISGSADITQATGVSGIQSVFLRAAEVPTIIGQLFTQSSSPHAIIYVDYFIRPGASVTSSSLVYTESTLLVFMRKGLEGQAFAYDGTGRTDSLDGTWVPTSATFPLQPDGTAVKWIRLTQRLNFVTKTWDLYHNGHLIAHDLKFHNAEQTYLPLFLVQGAEAVGSSLDYLYVGPENPLFVDQNNNGLDDSWEILNGLSLSSGNNRGDDSDNDGLTNLDEYRRRTDASRTDTDGDGIPDGVELALGLNPLVASPTDFPTRGLRLFLRADAGVTQNGGSISHWADQSGLGMHATRSHQPNQPRLVPHALNGRPVVRFEKSAAQSLSLPDAMAGAQEGDAFVVVKAADDSALWAFGGSLGNHYPTADGLIFEDFATNVWEPIPARFHDFREYHLYNVSGNAEAWTQRFNGRVNYQRTPNTVAFRTAPTLGAGHGYLSGDIAEVIVFDRVLGREERHSVNAYLSGKYALAPLAIPRGLKATPVSSSQVSLTWSDVIASALITYTIERQTNFGPWETVAEVENALCHLDQGLSAGATYSYRLKARSYAGQSGYTLTAVAATPESAPAVPTSALRLWLSADAVSASSRVAVWPDRSGRGHHALQAFRDQQPRLIPGALNGRPVLRFDAAHRQVLHLPDVMQGAQAGEAFAVVRARSGPGGLWTFGAHATAYPDAENRVAEGFGSDTLRSTGVAARVLGSFHLYHVSATPAEWSQRFNGVLHHRQEVNQPSFAAAPAIGQGAGFFSGDVAELLVFDRALTETERTTVSAYLRRKYALSLPDESPEPAPEAEPYSFWTDETSAELQLQMIALAVGATQL